MYMYKPISDYFTILLMSKINILFGRIPEHMHVLEMYISILVCLT